MKGGDIVDKPSWETSARLSTEECWVSTLMVMQSAAGYYIGRTCRDREEGGFPFDEPYSRESGYFRSYEEAEKALTKGFNQRDCVENNYAYAKGTL